MAGFDRPAYFLFAMDEKIRYNIKRMKMKLGDNMIKIDKKKHKWFTGLKWVIQALAKKDSKYALTKVLVDETGFVATNGRQLHIMEIEHELEHGFYDVKKDAKMITLTKSDIDVFPRYKDIILIDYEKKFKADSELNFLGVVLAGLGFRCILINSDFLKPFVKTNLVWEVWYKQYDRPVMLKAEVDKEKYTAIIMPIVPPDGLFE